MRQHAEQRSFRDWRDELGCVSPFMKPMQILVGFRGFSAEFSVYLRPMMVFLCVLCASSESASGR
jgi:hypothetical protein